MAVVLKGKELENYNKSRYSEQWLSSSQHRISSDYYRNDHFQDTLDALKLLKGDKVLECGIGTGEFFALGLAQSGKSVYGIDFSNQLLRDCKERFGSKEMTARLSMGDITKIPFATGSFDVTFAIGVMPYVEDVSGAIREMLRVTKKGGTVIFDVMNPWHISQCTNYWFRLLEGSAFGFKLIYWMKRFKQSLGFKANFKSVPDKVNFHLISPLKIRRSMKGTGLNFRIRGYDVFMPVNMPIFGNRLNICDRSRFFSHGLKDNRILKYFGSKLVVAIENL